MANEATLVERHGDPSDFTVDDSVAVVKGALMMMTDPRVAAIGTNGPVAVAGIAAREKVVDDGRINLAIYNDGKFLVSASGAIQIGDPLMISALATTYPNFVQAAGITASGGFTIGFAEETAANADRFLMRLQPGTAGGAIS